MTATSAPSTSLAGAIAPARRRSRTASWARFTVVCAIVFGLRWHCVDQVVVNWDESLVYSIAQDLAGGGTLYRTTWEHKGPFLFVPFVPVVAVAGASIKSLRLYTTGLLLATMLLVELMARRLFGRERSFVAPLLYGLFFSVPYFGGLATGSELVMMLPISLALLLLVVARTSRQMVPLLFVAGLAVASGGLIKASALYSGLTIPLVLLVEQLGEARRGSWRPIRGVVSFGAGCVAGVGATTALFAAQGRLGDFLFANVFFNTRHYVSSVPTGELGTWLPSFLAWAATGDLFTALALASAVFLLLKLRQGAADRWTATLVVALLITSFFGFTLGRRMFFHYYLQMALPFALLICWAVARLRLAAHDASRVACIGLALGLVSALSAYRDMSGVRSRDPKTDATLRAVATSVRENTGPQDRIYVLGGEPVIYFLAERRSPTRYFWWVFCTDPYDAGLASRHETLTAFARTPPRLFVYKRSDPRVVELEQFMVANYVPIATIDDYQIALYKNAKQPLPAR